MVETEQVSFRLSTQIIAQLKADARRLSYEQQRSVKYTDLVREALNRLYPIPAETESGSLHPYHLNCD